MDQTSTPPNPLSAPVQSIPPNPTLQPEQNTPDPTPPGAPKKMPKFVGIILFILLLLLLGGGTMVMNMMKKPEPKKEMVTQAKPSPTKTPLPTKETTPPMTTYENPSSGYSVQYASKNFVRLDCPGEELLLEIRSENENRESIEMPTCARDSHYAIEIRTVANTVDRPKTDKFYTITKSLIRIAGVESEQFTSVLNGNPDGPFVPWRQEIFIPHGELVHILTYEKEMLSQNIKQILESYKFTEQKQNIENIISFTLPTGWKKSSKLYDTDKQNPERLFLFSPDYKPGGFDIDTGVRITMEIQPDQDLEKSVSSLKKELPSVFQNAKSIFIDGLPGYSWDSSYEKFIQHFAVQNGNDIIKIMVDFAPPGKTTAKQYTSVISQFIKSVKIKK